MPRRPHLLPLACLLALLMPTTGSTQACGATIAATAQLVDNHDGTVDDPATGLTWKQCSEGQDGEGCGNGSAAAYTWDAAQEWAETTNISGGFAGRTGWRVPNIKELLSIVDKPCADTTATAVNRAIFPATPPSLYWSSSVVDGKPGYAWYAYFGNGDALWYSKTGRYHLRLVRGGQ